MNSGCAHGGASAGDEVEPTAGAGSAGDRAGGTAAEAPGTGGAAPAPEGKPRRLGKWWVTIHAVERWQQRYAPTKTYNEAFLELTHLSTEALLIEGQRRPDGKAVYLHTKYPEARFVVANDGRQDLPTLVVILDAEGHGTHRGMFARERRADNPRKRDGSTRKQRDRHGERTRRR